MGDATEDEISGADSTPRALSDSVSDWAEWIHDGPLQDLAAANFTLAVMRRTGFASLEEIAEVSRLVDSASERLRAIIAGRAASPAPRDMNAELRDLCAAFEADTGIPCRVALSAEHLYFAPEIADVVYRAVRELLTNVRKHAHATAVAVTSARRDGGDVTITVADDGVGLQGADRLGPQPRTDAFGLASIRQRLEELGGAVEIGNESGVRVTLVLPSGVGSAPAVTV